MHLARVVHAVMFLLDPYTASMAAEPHLYAAGWCNAADWCQAASSQQPMRSTCGLQK